MSYGIYRCPEQDSNLHASQHSHLKRARLPFRHLGFAIAKVGIIFFTANFFRCFFCGRLENLVENLQFVIEFTENFLGDVEVG